MQIDNIKAVINWFRLNGINDIIIPISNTTEQKNTDISIITDLDKLKAALFAVDCEMKKTANKFVFSDGNQYSKLVFIGEAPGAEEDKQGLPFVGQAGQLLNKAICAIGLTRQEVYITNVVPWRPLGNRAPTPAEISLFRPFLIQHINIINPDIVVCLGSSAAKAVLQKEIAISKIRGQVIQNTDIFRNKNIQIITTFHPSYLLRTPSQKKEFWHDFLEIKRMYSH